MGDSTETIRGRIMAELPAQSFARCPQRAFIALAISAAIVGTSAAIVRLEGARTLQTLFSLLCGFLYASLFFLGHEAGHGSIVRSRASQYFIMTLAFAIFLLSPTLWRVWHNHVHHAHTNSEVYDPDNFGTLSRCRLSRWVRFAAAVTLGEGNWLRLLCVPLWFSAHVQVVLWAQSRACLGFERLNRNRAIAETLGLVAFWMALCCSFGLDFTLLVVVLPMLVANTIIMSYVATNHLLRPLVIEPDLLETSMSVHTNRWLDIIHFKFSHHVEHHLFPTMSSRHASRVRQKLHEHAADRFLAPAHWAALRLVFATPRIHDGKAALVSPRGGARVVFEQLTEALRCKTSNGTTAPRPKSTSY